MTGLTRICALFALSFLFSLSPISNVHAQPTGGIVVTVVDASDAVPIPGANVALDGSTRGGATASDGTVRLSGIPTGTHTVVVRFVGYRTERRDVRVQSGETTAVRVPLTASPVGMRGIEVTALSPSLRPTSALSSERVREAESADTGELLRGVTGVNAARRGPLGFDPNVRGLSETEVGVYVGGMRTFPAGPLRMDSQLSHVDPSSISSVEVVKGPYALTWGPGNMSAIRVEPRGANPPNHLLTGAVRSGYDTNREAFESSVFAMGRSGNWFYSANGAFRTGDTYEAGNGAPVPAGYATGEGRGRIGYQVSDVTSLEVTGGYQEQQDIDYPGRLLNASFFKTGTGMLKLTHAPVSGTLRNLEVHLHAQQTLHEMDNEGKPTFDAGTFPNGNPRPPLRIGVEAEIQNFGGRVATDFQLGAWTLRAGGDVLHTYRNARRPLQAVTPNGLVVPPFYTTDRVWPGVTITQEGVFASLEREVSGVTLSGTVRLDAAQADAGTPSDGFLDATGTTDDDLSQSHVMPSAAASVSVPLSERWTVSVGGGTVARPPDALERYSDRFPATKAQTSAEFLGNPGLNPERSTQADVWIDGRGATWTLRASGFARNLSNYVTIEDASGVTPLLPLSPETVFTYRNGTATFYGAEVSARWIPVDALALRTSGAYLWGRDETAREPALGVTPPSGTLGARWTLPVETENVGGVYLDGSLRVVAEQTRVATSRGETPTDGYARVDLKSGVRLSGRVEIELGVENLFDETYATHLNARNPFSGARVLEPGRAATMNVSVRF